ncbi:hypothetical protein SLS53_002968 [Cytospora paraplurivora]|uniref:Uncharacterized protein n=1 Tax=Cytospora paraplurivora TaxID=2898453 RepID=A0AAN9UC46_9PEZI
MNVLQSAAPVLQSAPRGSLEVPRSEGITLYNASPTPSPRGSVFSIPPGGEIAGGLSALSPGDSWEEALSREKERAEARVAGLKKSFVDLTAFSASTNRRLDDTYYSVLEKLASLQNTIVSLKKLASASASTNDSFVAESRSFLSEAQAQLDAFGQFDEQEKHVQALEARVHKGQERIEALSTRVDVVRQKVERWERADREWQERTRRRLKSIWGVVLGLALVLLLLYIGAKLYRPELEEVAGGLKNDAMLAKTKLEFGSKGSPTTVFGERKGLDIIKDGTAQVQDEALRVLDEL